jgi:hypothetical protein
MALSGAPLELIARQFRHRHMRWWAKVYARFKPDNEEHDRWERIGWEHDAKK